MSKTRKKPVFNGRVFKHRTCKGCWCVYQPTSGNQSYCPPCAAYARWLQGAARNKARYPAKVLTLCVVCAVPFLPKDISCVCCSGPCREELAVRRQRARRRELARLSPPQICPECGGSFRRTSKAQIYCLPECVDTARRRSVKLRTELQQAAGTTWASLNPERVRAYCRSRRARKANAEIVEHYDWPMVFERDGTLCAGCDVDLMTLPARNRHLDHAIPSIQGGDYALHNIQGLCGLCNDKKGTKNGWTGPNGVRHTFWVSQNGDRHYRWTRGEIVVNSRVYRVSSDQTGVPLMAAS